MLEGIGKLRGRFFGRAASQPAPSTSAAPEQFQADELREYVKISLESDRFLLPDIFTTQSAGQLRDVFSGAEGSLLALNTSKVLSRQGRKDAAYMLCILKRDVGASAECAPTGRLVHKADWAIKNRLNEAAFNLSLPQMLPLIEAGMAPDLAQGYLLAEELLGRQYLDFGYSLSAISTEQCLSLVHAQRLTWSDFLTHKVATLTPKQAFKLLEERKIGYPDFCLHHSIGPEQIDQALADGVVAAQDYLKHTPHLDPALAEILFAQGRVSLADFLPYLRQIVPYGIVRLERVAPYAAVQPQLTQQLLRHVALIKSDIDCGIDQGYFRLQDCNLLGPNTDSLVNRFYELKQMERAEAAQILISNWSSDKPFARAIVDTIYNDSTNAADIERNLPMPTQDGSQTNKVFLTRALGFWFARQDYLSPKSQYLRQVALEEMQQAEKDALDNEQCMVDGKPLDTVNPAFRLEECKHKARLHLECFMADFQANGEDGWLCPDKLCGRRQLTPNEALDLQLGAEHADAIAQKSIDAARATDVRWQPCPSDGCPNGLRLNVDQEEQLDCRCCGVKSNLIGQIAGVGEWTTGDFQYARVLIEATKAISNARDADAHKPTRECYFSGDGVFRESGCDVIRCRCGCTFDVNFGLPKADKRRGDGIVHTFYLQAQRYRPLVDGLLGRMGLYKGIKRGATGQEVYPVLIANLAKLEAGEILLDPAP